MSKPLITKTSVALDDKTRQIVNKVSKARDYYNFSLALRIIILEWDRANSKNGKHEAEPTDSQLTPA
jgi:hypothetical protein